MNDASQKNEVSEELQRELIAIANATLPPTLAKNETRQQANHRFVEAVLKNFSPQYRYVLNGHSITRDDYIKSSCDTEITSVKLYDLVFRREENTIIVEGLVDCSCIYAGKPIHRPPELYFDVFARSGEKWLVMGTYSFTQPGTDADLPKI